MTTPPLSPAAQAVFDAYENAHDGEYIDGEWIPDERAMVAAELIARADAALATTREAAPGAEISYEDLDDLCSKFSFFTDDDESRDLLFEMLRAVWARAQAARPAADQQEGRDAAGEVQP